MSTTQISGVARLLGTAGLMCFLALFGPTLARADGAPLLRDKEVTEARILQALTPEVAPAAATAAAGDSGDVDVQVGTRSLRVSSAKTNLTAAPKKKASASLLITFETNSAALTSRSKEQLDVLAAALKNDRLKDFSFSVEGHADARGSSDVNMALSMDRAASVRNYLVTVQNVPEAKLQAVGKGDTEPMNSKDVAAPENRRVTIVTNER